MRRLVRVDVVYDRAASAGWGVRVGGGAAGDSWGVLTLYCDGRGLGSDRIAPLVRAGRRALVADGCPVLGLQGVSSSGPWLPTADEVKSAEAAVAAEWRAAEGGLLPDKSAPGRADRPGVSEERPADGPARPSRGDPPASADGPARPSRDPSASADGKAPAEEKPTSPRKTPEPLGQSVILTRRSRGRKRTAVVLPDADLVREMCRVVKAHISLHGSAPSFVDPRCKPAALNYIRSTTAQREGKDSVLEEVYHRLAAEA